MEFENCLSNESVINLDSLFNNTKDEVSLNNFLERVFKMKVIFGTTVPTTKK
jgi:hypothetical protein